MLSLWKLELLLLLINRGRAVGEDCGLSLQLRELRCSLLPMGFHVLFPLIGLLLESVRQGAANMAVARIPAFFC